MARIHDLTPDQRALVLLLRHEFDYSYRKIALKYDKMLVVRQMEADILTVSRGNSILVLSCSFKASKYISECWPR